MLKPLREQSIVLTGATSGIGLVTARMLAEAGASLVLAARNEEALRSLTDELNKMGARAVYAVADVGRESDVEGIAATARLELGGFDTWINNAAVSMFGALDEVEIADMRRLFETNFWGVVYGSRAAIKHFRTRDAGKLINLGSLLGERAIPMQGIYSASKHAVAGFTESLRIEVDAERLPVSISLIKPASIDTPYKDHAKNYMQEEPSQPPPVYDPIVVARAILHACEHHDRDLVVGGIAQLISTVSNFAPRITDHVMARVMPFLQRRRQEAGPIRENTLYRHGEGLAARTGEPAFTLKRSAFTRLQMHPYVALASGAALAGLLYLHMNWRAAGSRSPSANGAHRRTAVRS